MTIHPLGRDKAGRKMTSPPSVADQWSVSTHSRAFTKKKKISSTWCMSGDAGLFHHKPESLCKFGLVTKGMLRLEWEVCVEYFYCNSSGETPSWSSSQLAQSSIWLCDKYLINSWNISLALHALISNRTQACSCIYAGTVMAVMVEMREITLTILCLSNNSFHSSPPSHNKELMKGVVQ